MKIVLRMGSWLWRVARQPATLFGLLAGCAALGLLAGLGLLFRSNTESLGIVNRLAAVWLLFTLVASAVRCVDELCDRVAATGGRQSRARQVGDASTLAEAQARVQRALRLTGLRGVSHHGETTVAVFAARRLGQRVARAALYVGLCLAAGWAAHATLLGGAHPGAVLLLGQPTPLAQTGLTVTLAEEAVLGTASGELRLSSAQLDVSWAAGGRVVWLRPGQGVAVSGQWLRLREGLAAAGVRVEQPGARALAVYPIDGARPAGDTARVWFRPLQQEQLVSAPQAGLLVRLVRYAENGAAQHGLSVEVLDGATGDVLAADEVFQPATISARGYAINVTPEVAARVTAQPFAERIIWGLAGILLVTGLLAHLVWPVRRAWVALSAEGTVWLVDPRALPWDRHWLARLTALLAPPRDGALA